MKKQIVIMILICITAMFYICFGHDEFGTQNPWNRSERWYCEDIDMTIHFLVYEGRLQDSSIGVCQIDGRKYELKIGIQKNSIGFLTDEDNDEIYELVLDGNWHYQNQELLISVREDHLFGGIFQELIFTPLKER